MSKPVALNLSCPFPISDYPTVQLAHGSGGKLMHQLIERMFLAGFKSLELDARHDAALLVAPGTALSFTTDSYVVQPLFFPGGDIGSLAVYGTVNDLAMSGARPLWLSAGFILEEGFPMEDLWRVVQSMRAAAAACGVRIVTGDTKVVDRGKGDGVFINTAGIGARENALAIGPAQVRPGDSVIVSGDLGRHGMAIMAMREGLSFESALESDCAPLVEPVAALLNAGVPVHCMRDLTRGGLASALVEIAEASKMQISIRESELPVCAEVQGACELLGLDPMYVANEGRFAAFVPAAEAGRALEILRSHPVSAGAVPIGEVVKGRPAGLVTLVSHIGAGRIV
ncbi:MAG: hydrogenase expression/formation protein HypE, partial [Candidatus Omnitrophica bacterium]|nr:hydrogenase expression/formation protein HypE [Candidatus Omnitrophota bacterium]